MKQTGKFNQAARTQAMKEYFTEEERQVINDALDLFSHECHRKAIMTQHDSGAATGALKRLNYISDLAWKLCTSDFPLP